MAIELDLATIAHHEAGLIFPRFDADIAWRLGTMIHGWAMETAAPIVIDIRLFHQPLFFAALPGAVPDNVEWARRKRNVVERYHRSSLWVGRDLARKSDTLANRYGLALTDFAAHGGGFPIAVDGCGVIGCAAVSGLPQEDDHMLVVRGIATILGRESVFQPRA